MITSEQYGVWLESYELGGMAALIIKAPSSSTKAIANGCRLEFYIGVSAVSDKHKCISIGIRIFDTFDAPLFIPMPIRIEEELTGLLSFLHNRSARVAIYDELDSNVCSANVIFDANAFDQIWNKDLLSANIYFPDDTALAHRVQDSFCYAIDQNYGTTSHHPTEVLATEIELSDISTHINLSHTARSKINYKVDAQCEGLTQEQQPHHAININLGDIAYHAPQITVGNKSRELTDILFIFDRCLYLVESKSLCVNVSGHNKGVDRRIATIIKNSKKALSQLHGAIKAVKRQERIVNAEQEPVHIPEPPLMVHGIVIVSEFAPSSRWDVVKDEIYEIYNSTGAMIHILDISEFLYILKLSTRPTIHFNQSMRERFLAFYESGNINIKSIDSTLPCTFYAPKGSHPRGQVFPFDVLRLYLRLWLDPCVLSLPVRYTT